VISASKQNIASVPHWLGVWLLPNGTPGFHQKRRPEKVHGRRRKNNNFQLGSQGAAVRPDVKDFTRLWTGDAEREMLVGGRRLI